MQKKIIILGTLFLFFVICLMMVMFSIIKEEANGQNDEIIRDYIRQYDHDLIMKEGGIFDLREDSKRQDQRIHNMWMQWNEGQKKDNERLEKLEKDVQRLLNARENNKDNREVVAMISNEGGQVFLEHRPLIRKKQSKQDRELFEIVKQAGEVYRNETGRNPSCTIGGKQTTLETIIQRKIIQEGGYEIDSAGRRTNNPGSLRGNGVLRKVVKFHNIDNTKKWREYATMEDGIVDMMRLIDNVYKCKITIDSLFAYVKGPKAEKTKENMDEIKKMFANFYSL